MSKSRPFIKKSDLFVVLLVILISAAGVMSLIFKHTDNTAPVSAEIKINTKLYKTVNLTDANEPYTITVDGNCPVTLEISVEGVRFLESECPDKLCVHSGLIEANESAACLPAGVSVTVKGGGNPEIDGIVG